jgi:hypothetical protein
MKETLSISMQATANFCCLPQPTGLVALATNFISEQANHFLHGSANLWQAACFGG